MACIQSLTIDPPVLTNGIVLRTGHALRPMRTAPPAQDLPDLLLSQAKMRNAKILAMKAIRAYTNRSKVAE